MDLTGNPSDAADRSTTMATNQQPAGQCPNCKTSVPRSSVIIEYDASHGRGRYAECPSCETVITPI